jgi:hypothetical protein
MIVIAPDNDRSVGFDKVDDFAGIGPVIHQVAEHPKFIEFLPQRREGFQVGVKVGDDDDFHSAPRSRYQVRGQLREKSRWKNRECHYQPVD